MGIFLLAPFFRAYREQGFHQKLLQEKHVTLGHKHRKLSSTEVNALNRFFGQFYDFSPFHSELRVYKQAGYLGPVQDVDQKQKRHVHVTFLDGIARLLPAWHHLCGQVVEVTLVELDDPGQCPIILNIEDKFSLVEQYEILQTVESEKEKSGRLDETSEVTLINKRRMTRREAYLLNQGHAPWPQFILFCVFISLVFYDAQLNSSCVLFFGSLVCVVLMKKIWDGDPPRRRVVYTLQGKLREAGDFSGISFHDDGSSEQVLSDCESRDIYIPANYGYQRAMLLPKNKYRARRYTPPKLKYTSAFRYGLFACAISLFMLCRFDSPWHYIQHSFSEVKPAIKIDQILELKQRRFQLFESLQFEQIWLVREMGADNLNRNGWWRLADIRDLDQLDIPSFSSTDVQGWLRLNEQVRKHVVVLHDRVVLFSPADLVHWLTGECLQLSIQRICRYLASRLPTKAEPLFDEGGQLHPQFESIQIPSKTSTYTVLKPGVLERWLIDAMPFSITHDVNEYLNTVAIAMTKWREDTLKQNPLIKWPDIWAEQHFSIEYGRFYSFNTQMEYQELKPLTTMTWTEFQSFMQEKAQEMTGTMIVQAPSIPFSVFSDEYVENHRLLIPNQQSAVEIWRAVLFFFISFLWTIYFAIKLVKFRQLHERVHTESQSNNSTVYVT
ncbi:hypothetical protein [Algicola sagamiensis]|uniref:hypothetical protein n=1 Tax=Algicola sagamiensis TaxID=163869 RepID=UPI0012FAC82A|nr:hypothetical protein [Algicola sagamiensis]